MLRKLFYPTAALAMVIGGLLVTALASSASTKSTTTTVKVKVPSTQQTWTDTGINLSQGEKFSINATGRATPHIGSGLWVGPNGRSITGNTYQGNNCFAYQYAGYAFLAPRVPCWSLVGKIGFDGLSIFIGNRNFKAKSPVSGELYLGFNDDLGEFADNKGAFTASIKTR